MEQLIAKANGFAADVTGGAGGRYVLVTSADSKGAGTLRAACEDGDTDEPRWIHFNHDMSIDLTRPINVPSNTTIDARGQRIDITGRGLHVIGVRNVIITGLNIGPLTRSRDEDCISVHSGSDLVWIHHNDMHDTGDGLIDVTAADGPCRVTIDWNRFGPHPGPYATAKGTQWAQGKTMLIGQLSSDKESPDDIRATIHHNLFRHTRQRNPRVVNAWAHVYCNVLQDWGGDDGRGFAMQAGPGGKLVAHDNVFLGGSSKKAILVGKGGTAEEYENNSNRTGLVLQRYGHAFEVPYHMPELDDDWRDQVTREAGSQVGSA